MTDTQPSRPVSRPLSEISENEELRRVSARVSTYSLKALATGGERVGSRPGSEVRDDAKRISIPVHTITLNLADYTGTPVSTPKLGPTQTSVTVTAPTPTSAQPATSTTTTTTTITTPMSPSPITTASASTTTATRRKSLPPSKPEKPAELAGRPVKVSGELVVDLSETSDGISPLFMATRAALRPAATGPLPSPIEIKANKTPSPSPSLTSLDSPRSSSELSKSNKTSKPKWLKRASMTPVLRSKSRSPAASPVDLPEPGSPHFSSALPPPLPPRKFPTGPLDNTAGPSRPPQHPARDTISHHTPSFGHKGIRWGMGSGGTVVRSASNNSISSSSTTTTTTATHQRLPSSAQRVLGHAGHAVSKTWLRARGVGGSMSISALGQLRGEPEPPTSPGPLARKLSRDNVTPPPPEPQAWPEGVVKRPARNGNPRGLVFGRPLDITGRTWGVFDAAEDRENEDDYCQRRRRCLPAVAVRCVEYLTFWGPQEEGVFRISGRSSHINRIRQEFDAGADLDLGLCEPADLDPHAVASVFKSFIRELPEPIMPAYVESKLEEFLHKHGHQTAAEEEHIEDLATAISSMSSASWFLLADIIALIDLIPRHAAVNRMTHNALMISLGPTLRLSGEHVALLVRHRERIFDNPPLVSAADLIDFGSDDELLTLSPTFEDTTLPAPVPVPVAPKPRPMSRISKKPSFGNLLGTRASSSNMRRSQSEQAISVSPVPPRLALPERIVAELPTFNNGTTCNNGTPDDIEEEDMEVTVPDVKSTDAIEETHYAPGTVAARARVYSTPTPIADRFRRSSTLHDLLPNHPESIASSMSSSAASIHSTHSGELPPPPNPMVGLRRSPPLFFQSTASIHPTSKVVGTKRKDDAGTGEAPGGAKRLSSGPGPED